jgi:hypothetical protein
MTSGLSVSATYTFSKTIEEAIQQPGQQDNTASYIDDVARIKNRSLAFSDRPHNREQAAAVTVVTCNHPVNLGFDPDETD